MRHIAVMTVTASIGLVTMFVVDFADLFFISLLGDNSLTAAMGFAATLLYFQTSFSIGLMIAVSALAARKIGQGLAADARTLATNVQAVGLCISVPLAILFWTFAPELIGWIGAEGSAKANAVLYIRIVAPFAPVAIFGMICSGFLRAHGEARRAMNASLMMGFTNAVFDPILIFGFDLGLAGAAIATVLATLAMAGTAAWPIYRIYGGFSRWKLSSFNADLPAIMGIAIPTILTNLATPVGGFISMRFIAPYGDEVIAAYAVIGRMIPLAFCLTFSLSGAIGPIISQNFGAGQFSRMRETLDKSMLFAGIYILLIWPLLYFFSSNIADVFSLDAEGHELITIFAIVVAPLFFFNGMLFISNATFNNLDRPRWSTILNWLRNTLGILPFVWLGGQYYGPKGVLVGPAIGGIIFGIIGLLLAYRLIRTHEHAGLALAETPGNATP